MKTEQCNWFKFTYFIVKMNNNWFNKNLNIKKGRSEKDTVY